MYTIWFTEEREQKLLQLIHEYQKQYFCYDIKYSCELEKYLAKEASKNLKEYYLQRNDSEYRFTFLKDFLAFCKDASESYSQVVSQKDKQVLSKEGYLAFQNSFLMVRVLDELIVQEQWPEEMLSYLNSCQSSFLASFLEKEWLSCEEIAIHSKCEGALSFANFKEVLDYCLIGEWPYEDYLNLCQQVGAIQKEQQKVLKQDQEIFDSSLVSVAKNHPEYLIFFDKNELYQIKKKLLKSMQKTSLEESDFLVELVYKINKEYLKL